MLLLKGIKFVDSVDTLKCTWKIMLRAERRMQKRMYSLATRINQSACSLIRSEVDRGPQIASAENL